MAHETLPVVAVDKDRSLQEVLTRLTASRSPMGADAEPIVTAAHRLPAIAASFAPLPRRHRSAAAVGAGRARDRSALHASGRGVRARARRPQRRHDHADGVRQDALLQRAGARTRSCRTRRRARCICFRPRRSRRTSSRSCTRWRSSSTRATATRRSASSPTTATRRRTRGARFAARRTSCSAIPTWCTPGSCRTIRAGRSCSRTCSFVIIDELHAYRGVFGSHLANILRRLQRVCRHYGSDPIFICSSATIANPRELAEGLTGRPFELVEKNGAPRGEKFFLFVNPPVVNAQLGIRRSYLAEARRVALEFLQAQPAADPLRAEPARDGDPDDVLEGCVSRPAGRRGRHPRVSRRLPAEPPARDRARPARRAGARGGVDQRARARDRHRRARRLGDGGLSRHDRGDVAARRPRRPPVDAIGGGAGREQRAHRSVHHPQPVVFLRRVARARADQPRQPAHPARPREVRGVRAAVRQRRAFGAEGRDGEVNLQADPVRAGGRRVRPPRRRPVELDARVVSRRRRQPAVGVVGQLRRRRHDATASA